MTNLSPHLSELEELRPSVGYDQFRRIMASFVSGISVITSLDEHGQAKGLTCSAVCSVSASPPILLACVRTPSTTLDALTARGSFAVNFLAAPARRVSEVFASRAEDKFATVDWRPGVVTAAPVLDCVLAHAECAVHQVIHAGDHDIVLGRMVGGEASPDLRPLGYWRGGYALLDVPSATRERSA